jgi:hypothetical protein
LHHQRRQGKAHLGDDPAALAARERTRRSSIAAPTARRPRYETAAAGIRVKRMKARRMRLRMAGWVRTGAFWDCKDEGGRLKAEVLNARALAAERSTVCGFAGLDVYEDEVVSRWRVGWSLGGKPMKTTESPVSA